MNTANANTKSERVDKKGPSTLMIVFERIKEVSGDKTVLRARAFWRTAIADSGHLVILP